MKPVNDFRLFYEKELKPRLAELETERVGIANKIKLYGGIGLAISLLILAFYGPLGLVAWVVGMYFFYTHHAKAFREKYKHQIIRTMVTAEGLNYEHNSHISRHDYDKSKLFLQSINRYYGDDYVSGEVGKTNIRFSELLTQYERSNGKEKNTTTIFRGLFFIADFNKHFKGETIVLPDVAEKAFGGFGSFLQGLNVNRPQLVKLEDVEFEKQFVVYGTDQVEARYILSPALMQRILQFKVKAKANLLISFIDSHVFLAIPLTKNLFEAPPLLKTVDNYQQLAEYQTYIDLCVSVVETLDLNTRIWTKE
jgi:hypothetical protein